MSKIKSFAARRPVLMRLAVAMVAIGCMALLLTVTVFAKTTYVITDGGNVTVHKTYETDPKKVLDHLGVDLSHTDRYETQPTWGRHQITIYRAKHVTVDHLGAIHSLVFYGQTVGQLLQENGLIVPYGAYVSASADTLVTDGMQVVISTKVTVEETVYDAVPYETVYVETEYLRKGQSVVLTEGVEGVDACIADVTYYNGEKSICMLKSRAREQDPVSRLVAVGTGTKKAKPGVPVVGQNKLLTWEGEVLEFTHKDEFKATCYYRFPVDGEITAMGTPTRVGAIAVDPKVIPYWTKMYIVTQDGEYIYGVAVAEDCGTAIKGKWVDLFYETIEEARKFGRRQVDIYFLA